MGMRLRIKERKKELKETRYKLVLRESVSNEYEGKIAPEDFISLTYNPDYEEDIEARAKLLEPFSEKEAGKLLLLFNRDGKVIDHSGRARSNAAKAQGIKSLPLTIRIYPPEVRWEQIPDMLTNQFGVAKNIEGEPITVNKNKILNVSVVKPTEEEYVYRRMFYNKVKGKMEFLSGINKLSGLLALKGRYILVGSETEDINTNAEGEKQGVYKLARLSKNVKDKFTLNPQDYEKYEDSDYHVLTDTEIQSLGLK